MHIGDLAHQNAKDIKLPIFGITFLTQEYADGIGANGYAADAASAVDTARELVA